MPGAAFGEAFVFFLRVASAAATSRAKNNAMVMRFMGGSFFGFYV